MEVPKVTNPPNTIQYIPFGHNSSSFEKNVCGAFEKIHLFKKYFVIINVLVTYFVWFLVVL